MNIESRVVRDYEQLREKHKGISTLRRENLSYSISGELYLIDPESGQLWDTYSVRILIPPNYAEAIPIIYELENKIPKDQHINSDGSCCLAPEVEQMLILGDNYCLIDFVDKLVVPFLANQKLVEFGQGWGNGEYSHGGGGLLEYYKELLKTNKVEVVSHFLHNSNFLQNTPSKKTCFCGSRIKFKDCHKSIIEPLKCIKPSVFYKDVILIENHLKTILK